MAAKVKNVQGTIGLVRDVQDLEGRVGERRFIRMALAAAGTDINRIYYEQTERAGPRNPPLEVTFFTGMTDFVLKAINDTETRFSTHQGLACPSAPRTETRILIPDNMVKRLIGKNGKEIRSIEEQVSDTQIFIEGEMAVSDGKHIGGKFARMVLITGALNARLEVIARIHTFITGFYQYAGDWRDGRVHLLVSPPKPAPEVGLMLPTDKDVEIIHPTAVPHLGFCLPRNPRFAHALMQRAHYPPQVPYAAQ